MYLTKEDKEDIFKKFGKTKTNTGSTEGQIALFSSRINHLSNHLKTNNKDFYVFVKCFLGWGTWFFDVFLCPGP